MASAPDNIYDDEPQTPMPRSPTLKDFDESSLLYGDCTPFVSDDQRTHSPEDDPPAPLPEPVPACGSMGPPPNPSTSNQRTIMGPPSTMPPPTCQQNMTFQRSQNMNQMARLRNPEPQPRPPNHHWHAQNNWAQQQNSNPMVTHGQPQQMVSNHISHPQQPSTSQGKFFENFDLICN